MAKNIIPIDKNLIPIEPKLGWIFQSLVKNQATLLGTIELSNLDLTELWNLETIGIKDPAEMKTKEVLGAETIKFFQENIEGNRNEVNLPWRDGHRNLGDIIAKAEKRLVSNTRRLKKIGYYDEYDDTIKIWHDEGVIEIAPNNGATDHYLAHQAVIKNSSLTTKVQPVFDTSLKDEKGNSLNACLEKGPDLIEMIPNLLMQFRQHAFGVTADIRKAFLQISLYAEERDYLQFLW
ncbi:uncharacterized protein LOC129962151 [Argiope bruennichi]|uniref:uncharacterized protein LOC129962151 n=1 Tax=Argiope bruennichi TaxID=94029 RepID=UPI002493D571|nr:uncharacterized protein LOC129962151 [Argiope bruennichi]